MAQLVVRNLEESVKLQIQRRAKRNGRSMEEEVRQILRDAGKAERPALGLGSQIAARFRGIGLTFEIPEFKGQPVRPARFDE